MVTPPAPEARSVRGEGERLDDTVEAPLDDTVEAPLDQTVQTPLGGTGEVRSTGGDHHGPGTSSRWWHGIRVRVVTGYVVLLLLALVVSALATRHVLLIRLDQAVDDMLEQEIEELRRLVDGNDPETGEPFDDDVAAIFTTFLDRNIPAEGEAFFTIVDGRPFATSAGAPYPLLEDDELVERWAVLTEPDAGRAHTDAGEARYVAVPIRESDETAGVFVVAVFPASQRADVDTAVRVIAAVSAVVLLAASVAAWSGAGRVLRPVRRITATAREITDDDLSARIPVEGNDELAELGETFNAMLDRIEASFQGQRAFLDDVAHELRTPITIVRGHLELLGEEPDDRAETIDLVTDELDRMGRYVADLLVVARSEQPDFLRRAPVDFGELATGLLARVEALADRSWLLEAAPAPGRVVGIADEERLTQVVVNLADNAVRHTGPDDEIALGVASDGGSVRLWVRDDGPGVDPELAGRLFSRFSRGAGARRHPDSTGLGLAIVAAIAQAHGGSAAVHSEPGHGATFTVTIPLVNVVGTGAGP